MDASVEDVVNVLWGSKEAFLDVDMPLIKFVWEFEDRAAFPSVVPSVKTCCCP